MEAVGEDGGLVCDAIALGVFEQTDPVVLRKNGRPQATVFQPATDIDVVGVRLAYRL